MRIFLLNNTMVGIWNALLVHVVEAGSIVAFNSEEDKHKVRKKFQVYGEGSKMWNMLVWTQ